MFNWFLLTDLYVSARFLYRRSIRFKIIVDYICSRRFVWLLWACVITNYRHISVFWIMFSFTTRFIQMWISWFDLENNYWLDLFGVIFKNCLFFWFCYVGNQLAFWIVSGGKRLLRLVLRGNEKKIKTLDIILKKLMILIILFLCWPVLVHYKWNINEIGHTDEYQLTPDGCFIFVLL